jgi:hypothetical protein
MRVIEKRGHMGLSEKMKDLASHAQEGAKTSIANLVLMLLKLIAGLFFSVTLSMVAQELIGFEQLSFVFMSVVILGLFLKLATTWRVHHVLIFSLIYVLIGQLLRMYILLAP